MSLRKVRGAGLGAGKGFLNGVTQGLGSMFSGGIPSLTGGSSASSDSYAAQGVFWSTPTGQLLIKELSSLIGDLSPLFECKPF